MYSDIKYYFIISLKSYILSHKKVEERLADSVEVSTIVVNMIFERNTPKLNLTLYVPILILLALFLGSILIPSKLLHYENKALIIWPPNDWKKIFFQLHLVKNLVSRSLFSWRPTSTLTSSKICCLHLRKLSIPLQLLFSSLYWSSFNFSLS